MFDAKRAFKTLTSKQALKGKEFRERLEVLRTAHIAEMPAEVSTDDLFKFACEQKWIRETDEGFFVDIPD